MDAFRMVATNGDYASVSESDISALRAMLRGPLVQAGESGYEEVRELPSTRDAIPLRSPRLNALALLQKAMTRAMAVPGHYAFTAFRL